MKLEIAGWGACRLAVVTLLAAGGCQSDPVAPTPTSIEPTSGYFGQRTEVRIEGKSFTPTVKIDYRTGEGSSINTQFEALFGPHSLEVVTYLDAHTLTAEVPPELPLGTYELVVRAPDGLTGTLREAFTVLPSLIADGGHGDAIAADGGAQDSGRDAAAVSDAFFADHHADDISSSDTLLPDTLLPDTLLPDTSLPDTLLPDTLLPDTSLPDTAPVHDPPWWDPAYAQRVPLRVQESIAGLLSSGYSVVAQLDTAALIAGAELLPSGDDLRVVRTVGAAHQELDRRLIDLDTASTQVWFKLQADVDQTDVTYLLYFDNPAAGAPPAHWADSMGAAGTPSAVYLAGDDFEEEADGVIPGGWEGSSSYEIATDSGNKVLRVDDSSADANYLFAGDLGWTDVVVEARIQVEYTPGTHYGLYTRADGGSDFHTLFWGLEANDSLRVYDCEIGSATASGLTSSDSLTNGLNLAPAAGTSWHNYAVRHLGDQATVAIDGDDRRTLTLPNNRMEQGRIGVCAGYDTTRARYDDFVVRSYVEPEPVVTLGAVEQF